MITIKGVLRLAAVTIAAATMSGVAAQAATFKLKIGAGHPPVGLWVATIKDVFVPRITERVAKETGHKIEWTEAYGGTVCKLGECLEAVESGLLDIADVHVPTEPAKLLAHNFMFFVPFGTSDPRLAAKTVWDVYESTPALKKVLEDRYNQVFIGPGIVGNYGLVTNFKWTNVSELKGRKIAAIGPNMPWLQGTGAVGVQSTLNEAYTSMQTGVYDGWVMLADPILSFKLNEVSKQYVDMDFGSIATPLITMNKDSFNALPPEVRKIILEEGKHFNEAMGRVTYERQVASVARMKELGLEVRQASQEMKEAWAKQLANIPKQRFEEINKARMPGEVVYAYVKALKAAGHKFPRDWDAER
jgi:TRAP-type C4-dicarboxylate transport system substrate-binding protein